MNIFDVLRANLRQGAVTLRFPDRVAVPSGFRSLVLLDVSRCIGCGTCSYVCTSGAIRATDSPDHYDWEYDAGLCTYCGQCKNLCPVEALTMEGDRPPVYSDPEEIRTSRRVAYPACPECGQPSRPLSEARLTQLFGEVTDEIREWNRLCLRCRRRRAQRLLKEKLAPAPLPDGRSGSEQDGETLPESPGGPAVPAGETPFRRGSRSEGDEA